LPVPGASRWYSAFGARLNDPDRLLVRIVEFGFGVVLAGGGAVVIEGMMR
jgi:hypothetical protein